MPGDFDLVKERIDLVQLIGERVALRRAGRAYVGLCPFHAEKTPSFNVDPERRSYRCFGCQESGDCFTWLEKMDGLEPVEALRILAERAGVELTRRAPEEREHEKRLLAIHDTAHFYFRQALRGTAAGKAAAEYVGGRGITAATIEKFGLGYAPGIADGLLLYLRKKGYSDAEAVQSGLVIDHERGLFDRFRDRLMIPIRDGKGRVIAFAGRAMRAGVPAKYMNSPRTDLFDKGATLFALDVAKAHIRRKSEAVIVEGQFDAISAHQAGFDNVVASMGTALTPEQFSALAALKIERVVVCFDADTAGQRSAETRGRDLVKLLDIPRPAAGKGSLGGASWADLFVAVIPAGKGDPDEMVRTAPDTFRALVAGSRPLFEFVIEAASARYDLRSSPGARRFLEEVLPLFARESDPLRREKYFAQLSSLTGVPHETVRRVAAEPPAERVAAKIDLPAGSGGAARPSGEGNAPLERYLMAQLLRFPEEAARLDLDPTDLVDPDLRAIFELLRSGERPGPRYPARLADVVSALGASTPTPSDEDHAARGIEMAAQRVRAENVRRRIGEVRAELNRGDGDVGKLLDELAILTDRLTGLMRTREQDTVLRAPEIEDE